MLRHPSQWSGAGRRPGTGRRGGRGDAALRPTGAADGPNRRRRHDDRRRRPFPRATSMMLLLAAAQRDPGGVRPTRRVRSRPRVDPALGLRQGPALLPRRAAGPAGGGGRAVRGDGAVPAAPGWTASRLQAERDAAGNVDAVGDRLELQFRRGHGRRHAHQSRCRVLMTTRSARSGSSRKSACRVDVLESQVDHDVIRVVGRLVHLGVRDAGRLTGRREPLECVAPGRPDR